MKKFLFIFLSLFFILGLTSSSFAYVAASSNYRLEKDSLNFGGTDSASSDNYRHISTFGEIVSGLSFGSNNNASTGYRYMEIDSTVSSPIPGCTNTSACNYNSLATQDDGSCNYDCGSSSWVSGCTDKEATNYNPQATRDNGSCRYQTKLQARYEGNSKAIRLTWVNPPLEKFQKIVIVRDLKGYPVNPTDGLLIYEGKGESTPDFDVKGGQRYYYTAFVLNLNGIYSDGVVADEVVPLIIPGQFSGCTDKEATNYNPQAEIDDSSCHYDKSNTPFSSFPPGAPLMAKWQVFFLQPAERVKVFDQLGRVSLIGEKPVTVLIKFGSVVPSLKTIGLTLTDPVTGNKYSFLMHQSNQAGAYEATLSPLLKRGTYPVDIYVINYANQSIQHIRGRVIIPNASLPWVTMAMLLVGFLPLLIDLWGLLVRLFSYFLGRRRHDKPWGTVYDSVTKQPLDPVYVTAETVDALGKMKEVASAITDIDGRFSFFLPVGTYYLKANKTHYRFPSAKLRGQDMDELYRNLYFGAPVEVTGQNVINLNIPMDSIDFDWNEFAKTKTNFFRFYDKRKLWLNRAYKLFFAFGFILSVYVAVVNPSIINIVITSLYLALIIYNIFWRDRYKPLRVLQASTGEPLAFAIIRVFIPNLNQQIKSVVADELGRFYLLVRPGVYYYTVEEKQLDGSYLKVYQSDPINFGKGILTRDISVK